MCRTSTVEHMFPQFYTTDTVEHLSATVEHVYHTVFVLCEATGM